MAARRRSRRSADRIGSNAAVIEAVRVARRVAASRIVRRVRRIGRWPSTRQMTEPRSSSEPWSEVPPEMEEMLRAELARKQPPTAETRSNAPPRRQPNSHQPSRPAGRGRPRRPPRRRPMLPPSRASRARGLPRTQRRRRPSELRRANRQRAPRPPQRPRPPRRAPKCPAKSPRSRSVGVGRPRRRPAKRADPRSWAGC